MKASQLLCFVFLLSCFGSTSALAQEPVLRPGRGSTQYPVNNSNPNGPRGSTNTGQGNSDSSNSAFERRDYSDDSLQVKIYTLLTTRAARFDTSISDYTLRFPIPGTHVQLGNTGSATKSYLFTIPLRSGWDPGFHSLDAYKFSIQNLRFYNTPKPYTELGYTLAARGEQLIEVLHTQNLRPYWNASFHYRLLSAPGIFRNQKNNHNNISVTSWYQSINRRYNNYFIILQNKLQAGESGGIRTDEDYLTDPTYERNRFTIPTNIGGNPSFGNDLFSTTITTGRKERDATFFMRQQYDFGRKDSLVTDSIVTPLFFPRVRFEHEVKLSRYRFSFQDFPGSGTVQNTPDSVYYDSLYAIRINNGDSVFLEDRWRELTNSFSIYQFPDANNLQQYIKLGVDLQLLKGTFTRSTKSYYNIIGNGEYRNRTKNGKWDLAASGRLHLAGLNIGDYTAFVSLQRLLSEQLGTLQIGFANVNRSPSFTFNQRSSFYLDAPKNFSKENTLQFFAGYYIPRFKVQLNGDYYLVSNYLYLNGYRALQQENALFNLLRVSAKKTFRLNRFWNVYTEVYLQQKAGGAEVNVPLFYTRNRLAYEGLFFRNLNLSAGLEMRYHTPYKGDDFSPVLGQYFYQDSVTLTNRPYVHAFAHFRIRKFKAYLRAENLNTITTRNGFGFKKHNLAAPGYPIPGLNIRFGIYWTFIN